MKKIKFGSFPLVDMAQHERQCIDNYCIKSFADLITMNTQMKSTSRDVQKYITPDVILKYFKSGGITDSSNPAIKDNHEIKDKIKTMKRAFKSLQNFTKIIQGNPFYKDRVTYPIYIEHENKNNSHDYDFILLANDLISKEILDEIKYDDALTLTFLFIKDMLYPRVPLSDVGTSAGSDNDSFTIRSDIAKFIEFSKSNNTDPISAMLKLIKIAGAKKTSGVAGYSGLKSFIQQDKAINQSISNKFFKLFGGDRRTGQIKDVNFLLNEIKHINIADFFDDTQAINKSSHVRFNGIGPSPELTSDVERQYLAQKTQDYNKILSMVDSLINFNSAKKVMEDVDSAISDKTIKLKDAHGKDIDVNIDYDKIIGSLRNDYFEAFLINMIQKLNTIQEKYLLKSGANGPGSKTDVYKIGESNANDIEHYNLELASVDRKLNAIMNGEGSYDQNEVDNLKGEYRRIENRLAQLNTNAMFISAESREQEQKVLKNKKFESHLKYNIESVQSELTGVLNDIESTLYDVDKLQPLFDLIGNKNAFSKPELLDLFRAKKILGYNVEQLTIAIFDSMKDTITEKAIHNQMRHGETITNSKYSEDAVVKFMNKNQNAIESLITSTIQEQLYLLFKRLGREYGDKSLFDTQQYADLRTERNTIIRKTITNEDNFKTYILNETVILNLYNMLNHVDTQKYIAGLIAYPPAKINNELNIIKYMIKRLGLENNPVFIIGKSSVILSQPDFLSLTGSSVFSKISFAEMQNICRIDYSQLWSNNQMFKKATSTEIKSNKDSYRQLFQDIAKELKIAKDDYTKANDAIRMNKNIIANKKSSIDDVKQARLDLEQANLDRTASAKLYNSLKAGHENRSKDYEKENKMLSGDQEDRTAVSQPYGTSSYRPETYKSKGEANDKPVYKEVQELKKFDKTHNKDNRDRHNNNYNQKKRY